MTARGFDACMAALHLTKDILRQLRQHGAAVAVSGGGDSMALALLLKGWCRRRNINLVALTVDHGLRKDSKADAAQVAAWMNAADIAHTTLRWRGVKPQSDVQAAARHARYDLMTRWCQRRRIPVLFLAHHLEDQAETFLMRLARGSGVYGLSGMAPLSGSDPVLARPLLQQSRQGLQAWLRRRNQDWLEDPSNTDPRFSRVRVRQALPYLAGLGLDARTLAGTAERLARARDALEVAVEDLLAAVLTPDGGGVRLDAARLLAAPEELGLRALSQCLQDIGGKAYPGRLARLEALYGRLDDPGWQGSTLSGCALKPLDDGWVLIRPEKKRRQKAD